MKQCLSCNEGFTITDTEVNLYEKVGIILPLICLQCRHKQHMAFWPFGKFRIGKSDLSGEKLITVLPDNARYPIYTSREWWSDAWDPMDYGQEYDPTRPFFDQLKELQEKVPRPHQQGAQNIDCDWCDDAWESKNCYLSRSVFSAENLIYGYRSFKVKDSIDVSHVFDLEKCYDCVYCFNSYELFFSRNTRDCMNSSFLFDCRNCSNCFMCWNLRGKSYCILNVQYTKEEYMEKMEELNFSSYKELKNLRAQYQEILRNEVVHRENFSVKTYDSIGSYLSDCKSCINAFFWEESENCVNCLRGREAKDCIDMTGCWKIELSGNNSCCTNGYKLYYSIWCDGARYCEYCDECLEIDYCFGCVSLRKKKYCILNRQYTKEEYEALKLKIVADMKARGEYGAFVPYSMGLCPYNFSTSAIYFPEVTKEFVLAKGGYWDEGDGALVEGMATEDLPDLLEDVDANICKQALICPVTGWRFNISEGELSFLKKMKIALPRVHFDVRTKERMITTNPSKSEVYNCVYCDKNINAFYPKDWGYQKIACEDCYLKEIS